MYSLFVNSVPIESQPDELKDFAYELIRDGGVSSNEQIFRKYSDATFTFFGDGYDLIVSNPICELMTIEIFLGSRLIFSGHLNPLTVKKRPHKRELTAPIYDSGFSAMIREKGENQIQLSVSGTIDGEPLQSVITKNANFALGIAPFLTQRNVYDVLDCFKFIVGYLTNNKMSVASNYLTDNKLCIIKGGSLGLGNTFDARFLDKSVIPSISFNDLFREVRKKMRIYAWIEGDVMYIEHENDSYSNTPIKIINGIPIDLESLSNNEYIYAEILVGSGDFKPDDNFYLKYPYKGLDTWQNESFTNCGCALQNELDLVSEWIIHSNVILETLLGDFENRFDDIFLLYYVENNQLVAIEATAFTNTIGVTDLYFNKSLQNYEVLKNWFGGLPDCISRIFTTEPCFNLTFPNVFAYQSSGGLGADYFLYSMNLTNVNCDSLESAITNAEPAYTYQIPNLPSPPISLLPYENNSIFVTKYDGTFSFNIRVNADNVLKLDASTDGVLTRYRWTLALLKFDSFADYESITALDSVLTLVDEVVDLHNLIPNFNSPFNYTFDLDALNIPLLSGEVIAPVFLILSRKAGNNYSLRDTVRINSGEFSVTSSELDRTFIFAEDSEMNQKVIYTDVLDLETQNAIEANQRGYIEINGLKFWIKKLAGSIGKIGNFELIGRNELL